METKSKSNETIGVLFKPNTQPRADFDVFTFLEKFNHKYIKCNLPWDFNINLLNYGHHDKTNTYVDSIFSLCFLPHITNPTRAIISNATNGIIINDLADHFGIFFIEKHEHSSVNIKQNSINYYYKQIFNFI